MYLLFQERVLLLEQRELTWQSFPVAEAIVVQELVGNIDEAVNVEFTDDTMAADMYGYLEQLEVCKLFVIYNV